MLPPAGAKCSVALAFASVLERPGGGSTADRLSEDPGGEAGRLKTSARERDTPDLS